MFSWLSSFNRLVKFSTSKKARGRRAFKNGENLFEDYGGAVVV